MSTASVMLGSASRSAAATSARRSVPTSHAFSCAQFHNVCSQSRRSPVSRSKSLTTSEKLRRLQK